MQRHQAIFERNTSVDVRWPDQETLDDAASKQTVVQVSADVADFLEGLDAEWSPPKRKTKRRGRRSK